MLLPGILVAYAVIVGTAGGWLLRRFAWFERAPMLGVRAWQITQLSALLSVAAAGLLMVGFDFIGLSEPPPTPPQTFAADFTETSLSVSSLLCLSSAVLIVGLFLTVGLGVLRSVRRAKQSRDSHIDGLTTVARHDSGLDAMILDNDRAAAYCLAGSRPTVVLTSAALTGLSQVELRAVIAHEREHLRGRHDLQLTVAAGLRWAIPMLPLFRWGHDEQARLLEMVADDAAARCASRRVVATAMIQMTELAVPEPALNAGGRHTVGRVHRLLAPVSSLGQARAGAVVSILALVVLMPVGVAATPVLANSQTLDCGIVAGAGH